MSGESATYHAYSPRHWLLAFGPLGVFFCIATYCAFERPSNFLSHVFVYSISMYITMDLVGLIAFLSLASVGADKFCIYKGVLKIKFIYIDWNDVNYVQQTDFPYKSLRRLSYNVHYAVVAKSKKVPIAFTNNISNVVSLLGAIDSAAQINGCPIYLETRKQGSRSRGLIWDQGKPTGTAVPHLSATPNQYL